jgi:hypothetical protein
MPFGAVFVVFYHLKGEIYMLPNESLQPSLPANGQLSPSERWKLAKQDLQTELSPDIWESFITAEVLESVPVKNLEEALAIIEHRREEAYGKHSA